MRLKMYLWRLVAIASIFLGFVGIFIPGLPTVPFMILAAWAASRGWPQLERWLLNHQRYGPYINRWRERGAVPRRAKISATLMMFLSVMVLITTGVPGWAIFSVIVVMGLTLTWMWRLPE